MSDLTPDEIAFFATGELPEALAASAAPVIDPVPDPVVAPVAPVEVAPAQPDATELLRQSLAQEQSRRATAEAQMAEIQRQLQEKMNPPIPAPDPVNDPLGAMMHQLNQVNGTVQQLQAQLAQQQNDNAMKSQFQQFTQSVQQIKDAFIKTTPDFNDAYNHIRNVRTEDLKATGTPVDQINQIMLQDEINIAQTALRAGKNPAQEMYNMSKRYGYQPKAAPATPEQKVANLIKGQEAARDPGKGGGSVPTEMTTEGLKDASSNDLTRIVMDDKAWAKIVGGKGADIF